MMEVSMADWINIADRLPAAQDANAEGLVWFLHSNGNARLGMWDWIQPVHPQAKEIWIANGFVAWLPADSDAPLRFVDMPEPLQDALLAYHARPCDFEVAALVRAVLDAYGPATPPSPKEHPPMPHSRDGGQA
jgi:hypothetical protein